MSACTTLLKTKTLGVTVVDASQPLLTQVISPTFKENHSPISRITPPLMTRLCIELENQGRTNATINRFISAVSTVLKFCVDEQLIKLDIPRFQRRKEAETMRKYYTKDQVKLICKEAEDIWQRQDLSDIVLFAALTGMRQGEILRLRVKHVDFITNNVHVGTKPTDTTKNGTYRAIPIHPELEHMLVDRTKDTHPNALVFGNDWVNKKEASIRTYCYVPSKM